VVLERDPLNLVSVIEELLGRKSSGSGLEIRSGATFDNMYYARTGVAIVQKNNIALRLHVQFSYTSIYT
jgi:hypothetical protein